MKRTGMMVAVFVMASVAGAVLAESPVEGVNSEGQVVLSWEKFVKITGYDDPSVRKGTLTIPWEEVEKLLGLKVERVGKDATVDLPWKEFKALLEWSVKREAQLREEGPPSPVNYVVISSQYKGELTASEGKFTRVLKLDVLRKKGWKRIPVLPGNVAIMSKKLPEGVYLNSTGKHYELLTRNSGEMEVELEFSVAVRQVDGVNHLGFSSVPVCSSVLDLSLDRENIDVKVAGAQSQVTRSQQGKTIVAAAIPSCMKIAVSWQRALPKVEAAPTKLYAETQTLVRVADGMLVCDELVKYNILHTPVRELNLTVPKGVSVLTVSGGSVQDWRVDDKGQLLVVLSAEKIGEYFMSIRYEAPSKEKAFVPVIHPVGVERERGFIGVAAIANVEIDASDVSNATRIDVRKLPAGIAALTKQPVLLGFRYLTEKFNIALSIQKHDEVPVLVTIVDNVVLTGMQLADGRRMTKAVYGIRNNRNQFLRMKLPDGVDIWSVSVGGNTVAPARDGEHVLIPLVRSASGSRELGSFPVTIVYVEAPKGKVASKGKLRIDLPQVNAPIMHVMYNLYLPAEGNYEVPEGLFGSRSGFGGPLRRVDNFSSMATGSGSNVVKVNAQAQAAQLQQQFNQRVDAQIRASGATPIRVRLPINGKMFKFEKILTLPDDKLFIDVQYSGWEIAK